MMTWAVKERNFQARIKIIIWALAKHFAPFPTPQIDSQASKADGEFSPSN